MPTRVLLLLSTALAHTSPRLVELRPRCRRPEQRPVSRASPVVLCSRVPEISFFPFRQEMLSPMQLRSASQDA